MGPKLKRKCNKETRLQWKYVINVKIITIYAVQMITIHEFYHVTGEGKESFLKPHITCETKRIWLYFFTFKVENGINKN